MAKVGFLGGLSEAEFCEKYWQKKPLLVRGAFPGFEGVLSPDELAGLACEEDAKSRIVRHRKGQYTLENGPFDEATFAALPGKNWTLLVQGGEPLRAGGGGAAPAVPVHPPREAR